MKWLITCGVGALIIWLTVEPAVASLRCGTHLISRGSTELEVLHYCGAPSYSEQGQGYSEIFKRWIYYTRRGSFAKIVYIRNVQVVDVKSGERLP